MSGGSPWPLVPDHFTLDAETVVVNDLPAWIRSADSHDLASMTQPSG